MTPTPDSETRIDEQTTPTRRRVLTATGALAVGTLAGCSGSSDGSGGGCTPPEDLSGPVPEAYEGAESKGGLPRKPSKLLTKSEADHQDDPNGDQQCSKCAYFIPDKNDDCAGACVRVEGLIPDDGYCEYYRTQVGGGW